MKLLGYLLVPFISLWGLLVRPKNADWYEHCHIHGYGDKYIPDDEKEAYHRYVAKTFYL